MTKTISFLFVFMLGMLYALGQTATSTTAVATSTTTATSTTDLSSLLDKDVLVIAGPSYVSGDGTPQVGGTVGVSFPFSTRLSGGVLADILFRKTGTHQTNIRGQISYQAFTVTLGQTVYPINLLEDVGSAFASSTASANISGASGLLTAVLQNVGTNVGYVASTGIGTDITLPHSIHAQPYFRLVKGSLNDAGWQAGVNFGFKVHVTKLTQ